MFHITMHNGFALYNYFGTPKRIEVYTSQHITSVLVGECSTEAEAKELVKQRLRTHSPEAFRNYYPDEKAPEIKEPIFTLQKGMWTPGGTIPKNPRAITLYEKDEQGLMVEIGVGVY